MKFIIIFLIGFVFSLPRFFKNRKYDQPEASFFERRSGRAGMSVASFRSYIKEQNRRKMATMKIRRERIDKILQNYFAARDETFLQEIRN